MNKKNLIFSFLVLCVPWKGYAADYKKSNNLNLIQAYAAYEKGYTGKGILVAVMDTGVDLSHPKFSDKISNSYSMFTGKPIQKDNDGHGTHVAGIIAASNDGKNMHGVAYDAEILPIKILSDSEYGEGAYDAQLSRAIRFGFEKNAKISNNSWGYVEYTSDGNGYFGMSIDGFSRSFLEKEYPKQIDAYKSAILKHDQLFVFAAGNVSNSTRNKENPSMMGMLPSEFSEFKGHWITVVNVKSDGVISKSSHHCGKAAAWCLAAPGTDILSTVPNNEYERYTGTSMAAPHVSGGLALLAEAFPNLKGEQLVNRLLTTADKSGHYANSQIYGQGLMRIDKAIQPVGTLRYGFGKTVNHKTKEFTGGIKKSQRLPFLAQLSPRNVLVLDSFDSAPFYVPIQDILRKESMSSRVLPFVSPTRAEKKHYFFNRDAHLFFKMQEKKSTFPAEQDFSPYAISGKRYTIGQENTDAPFRWQITNTADALLYHPSGQLSYDYKLTPVVTVGAKTGVEVEKQQAFGVTSNNPILSIDKTPTLWQGITVASKSTVPWSFDMHWAQSHIKTPFDSGIKFPKTVYSYAWRWKTQTDNPHHNFIGWVEQPVTFLSSDMQIKLPASVDSEGNIGYETETLRWQSNLKPYHMGMAYVYTQTPRWATQYQMEAQKDALQNQWGYWFGIKTQYHL